MGHELTSSATVWPKQLEQTGSTGLSRNEEEQSGFLFHRFLKPFKEQESSRRFWRPDHPRPQPDPRRSCWTRSRGSAADGRTDADDSVSFIGKRDTTRREYKNKTKSEEEERQDGVHRDQTDPGPAPRATDPQGTRRCHRPIRAQGSTVLQPRIMGAEQRNRWFLPGG